MKILLYSLCIFVATISNGYCQYEQLQANMTAITQNSLKKMVAKSLPPSCMGEYHHLRWIEVNDEVYGCGEVDLYCLEGTPHHGEYKGYNHFVLMPDESTTIYHDAEQKHDAPWKKYCGYDHSKCTSYSLSSSSVIRCNKNE